LGLENIQHIQQSIEHGWSRNVLVHQIESGFYHALFILELGVGLTFVGNQVHLYTFKPIGVSSYRLIRALPEEMKSNLPSVEELERKLGS